MPELKLSHEDLTDEVTWITVVGTLDAQTAPELETWLESHLSRQRHRLAVDLTQVDYISSAGVGVFVAAIKHARDAGGDLIFVYPKGLDESDTGLTQGYNALEIFNMLGLLKIIKVVADRSAALAELGGTPA